MCCSSIEESAAVRSLLQTLQLLQAQPLQDTWSCRPQDELLLPDGDIDRESHSVDNEELQPVNERPTGDENSNPRTCSAELERRRLADGEANTCAVASRSRAGRLRKTAGLACQTCDKVFKKRSLLEAHVRRHNGEEEEEEEDPSFACTRCDRAFPDRAGLAEHRKTHPEEGGQRAVCHVCGGNYKDAHTLKVTHCFESGSSKLLIICYAYLQRQRT